jgi:hypothetical protein
MYLTLALVVLFASIAVFFSQEFISVFKKLFAIKGVKLFLPLFLASWFVFTFDYWALWIVYYYREMLQICLTFLVSIMPFQEFAEQVSLVIFLWAISVLPVFIIDQVLRRKTYKGYQYPNVTSMIVFLVSAILLLAL